MSFSHRDGYFTITPDAGPNKGKPKRIKAGEKVSFDPGGKTSYMKGFEQVPIAIARGSAEPKLDVDVSSGAEAWLIRAYVGQIGGYTFTCSYVFRRPGLRSQSFRFTGCELENGGGIESDDGKGVASKLSIKMLDCLHNGVSVFARRYSA